MVSGTSVAARQNVGLLMTCNGRGTKEKRRKAVRTKCHGNVSVDSEINMVEKHTQTLML